MTDAWRVMSCRDFPQLNQVTPYPSWRIHGLRKLVSPMPGLTFPDVATLKRLCVWHGHEGPLLVSPAAKAARGRDGICLRRALFQSGSRYQTVFLLAELRSNAARIGEFDLH